MNLQTFLSGLLLASTLTSLVTEAVKGIFVEKGKPYYANTIAGVASTIVSFGIGGSYTVLTDTPFSDHVVVYLIALMFLSWLCAMVGYDKVIQAISQFKTYRKD